MTKENDEKKTEGKVELSVDELEEASGGYVLYRGNDYDGSFPYVVINDETGKKGTHCNRLDGAKGNAKANGFSDEVISEAQYKQLFGK